MSEPSQPKPGPVGKGVPATIGRYQVARPLGKGAMGVVYLAHDPMLERDVALKVMAAQIGDDPDLGRRFAREARAVAKMTHPNVVTVFDLGDHEGAPYIAMELLKGQDLAKAMRTAPAIPLERKIGIVLQVLAGLAHAHEAGIVHRDIKPANIFINHDGSVKIMDFGVARLTTASMTGTGNIIGTADYMSPEQVKGAKVDGRSDLFSVGCVLYEMLTGRRPYQAENLMAIFYKITHEEMSYEALPPGPEYQALRPILEKAMAKDLDARYQTAYELAVDLKEYLRAHASSQSAAEHELEGLLDIEPSIRTPRPLTDAPGVRTDAPGARTVRGGQPTLQGGAATGAPSTGHPRTVRGADSTVVPRVTTVLREEAPPTNVVADLPLRTTPMTPRPGRPLAVARRPGMRTAASPAPSWRPVLYAGGVVAVALGVAAYVRFGPKWGSDKPSVDASPSLAAATSLAAAPGPTLDSTGGGPESGRRASLVQAAVPSLAPTLAPAVPPTVAPTAPPTIAPPPIDRGKAAADLKAAEERLRTAEAQKKAEQEQRAQLEAQQKATLEAQQKATLEAQQKAQQAQQQRAQLVERLDGLLGQADNALSAQNYDGAIALYDEALKLDAQNARATQGRSAAVAARAIARASDRAGRPGPAAKAFVSSGTQSSSAETRLGTTPQGFEPDNKVRVQRATQAAELPGKILFEVEPAGVKAGDQYKVRIYLLNQGNAPIQIRDMLVGTRINGRGAKAPLAPQTKDVAPLQKALLREIVDSWREEVETWTMEVQVRTARGETYTNQVSWK